MLLAKNVCKKYNSTILDNVTISVNDGEVVGVAGANGSGKSTLLSILAGITTADTGEIVVDGKIGYVPQETSLFNNLSVKDNLNFWASAYNINLKGQALLSDKTFLKKRVKHLSGGMKKQLSIDLALLDSPNVLIMDEPTCALDIGFKGELLNRIKKIIEDGVGVIFSTHQPDELLWCDRVYILKEGGFIYEGSPKDVELADVLYGEGLDR